MSRIILIAALVGLALLALALIVKHQHIIYLIAVGFGAACLLLCPLIKQRSHQQFGVVWLWLSGAGMVAAVATVRSESIPTAYLVLMSVSAGLLFLSSQRYPRMGMVLACVMILFHVLTANLIFPSLLGLDPWSHMETTTRILDQAGTNGYPPWTLSNMGGSYSLMHVYLREVMDTLSLSYKTAALLFWSIPQAIGIVVLVYLIGKEIWNRQVGAAAAILAANAGWVVFFSQWAIPNGMGVPASLLVAWIMIRAYKRKGYWPLALLPVILGVTMLTNFLSVVWVAGTIMLFSCLLILRTRKAALILPSALLVLFGWYMVSYMHDAIDPVLRTGLDPSAELSYTVGFAPTVSSGGFAPTVSSGGFAPTVSSGGFAPTVSSPTIPATNHLLQTPELFLNVLGMLMLMGIGLTGIIAARRALSMTWSVYCAAVVLISFVPPIFGISVLEHRWYYLGGALMTLPAAVILSRSRPLIAASLVSLLVFFALIAVPANTTNRILSPNLVVRYSLTGEEMQAAQQLSPTDERVATDPLYALYLKNTDFTGYIEWIPENIVKGDYENVIANTLILRKALYTEPFGYGAGTIYRLRQDPTEQAIKQGYTEVWSNSEISLLRRTRP